MPVVRVQRILLLVILFVMGCGVDELLDNSSAPNTASASPRPATVECFETFEAFKRKMHTAGDGKDWHHLVNKNPRNEARSGSLRLHCTDNVIPLDRAIHQKLSGFYNSKQQESGAMLVRDWQSQFDWNTQRAYAIQKVRDLGGKLPDSWTH